MSVPCPMKFLACLILFLMVAMAREVSAFQQNWGAPTNDIQISIRLDGGEEKVGTNSPVKLLIRFRNLSTNWNVGKFFGARNETDEDFKFTVISPSGKDVSPVVKPEPPY